MEMKERIENWVSDLSDLRKRYDEKCGYHIPTNYIVKFGKKNAKIIIIDENGNDRSVFCFIDMSNGDILKAASWNAPAKGSRGNIINNARDVGPYGAIYLNGGGSGTYNQIFPE